MPTITEQQTTLGEVLAERTAPAAPELIETLPNNARALLLVRPSLQDPRRAEGDLQGPLQRRRRAAECRAATSAALQVDPIEKKPFFHAYPGRAGALVRHARLRLSLRLLPELGDVAGAARSGGRARRRRDVEPARTGASREDSTARRSSPRPTTSRSSPASGRWRCSRRRRRRGLVCSYVSNGNGTPQVLDYIAPYVDAVQGRSQGLPRPPLPRARRHAAAGARDDPGAQAARHLGGDRHAGRPRLQRLRRRADAASPSSWPASIRDIPWHITAFHRTTR